MDPTDLPETEVSDQPEESGDPEQRSPFDPVEASDTTDVSSWAPFEPHDVTHEVDPVGDDGSSMSVEVTSPAQNRLAVTGPVLTDPLSLHGEIVAAPLISPEAARRMGGRRFLQGVLLGALVGALVAAVVGFTFERFSSAGTDVGAGTLNVRAVLDIIEPAVVKIEVRTGPQGRSAGTGFVISADGNIVTNSHVVDGATQITVLLSDGRELEAQLLGADPTRDLAVIKIDANDLPVATLGSSAALTVGDPVLAIGNALDLLGGPTVTTGIVSALDRVLPTETTRLTNVLQN